VLQTGRGKGDALACGFAACTGDIIVMIDADGSTDAAEIPRFVDHLRGGADFVKGSRYLPGGGSTDLTRLRDMGNWGLNQLVNVLHRTRYTDLCYGYNAFWAHHLPRLDVDCDGFEVETLMNIRAARAGLRVREVPSFEGERLYGESKLRTFPDGWRVLRTIWSEFLAAPGEGDGHDASSQVELWDGKERRSGRDRRGSRRGTDRRSSPGRRWTDVYAVPREWATGLPLELTG
jgi:glycosyltransferase involved in cell wall biosynthesis